MSSLFFFLSCVTLVVAGFIPSVWFIPVALGILTIASVIDDFRLSMFPPKKTPVIPEDPDDVRIIQY